jgi:hypothetical protein
MTPAFRLTCLLVLLMVGACTTVPSGPGVMALPGSGKSFDQFRADDSECRQYASMQVGGTAPNQAAADSGIKSAAVGTVVGAAAGAAIGGSRGAAVGAGTGLAVGALAGAGAAEGSAYALQRRYDYAYLQCMYAKGHKVPVSGNLMSLSPNPGASYTPPPPPGSPPPPAVPPSH